MKLTGNTVVVTGGTSGIGMALVEKLLVLGNVVVTCGRRADRLDELRSQFPSLAARACDLADERQRAEFAQWVGTHHPATNVLVNNAGIQLAADLSRPLDLAEVSREVSRDLKRARTIRARRAAASSPSASATASPNTSCGSWHGPRAGRPSSSIRTSASSPR